MYTHCFGGYLPKNRVNQVIVNMFVHFRQYCQVIFKVVFASFTSTSSVLVTPHFLHILVNNCDFLFFPVLPFWWVFSSVLWF